MSLGSGEARWDRTGGGSPVFSPPGPAKKLAGMTSPNQWLYLDEHRPAVDPGQEPWFFQIFHIFIFFIFS
jgi:hypothetical protein